jgi:tRNA 2-selenouridine synthase
MSLPLVSSQQWDELLLSATPLIDVRAPVEFAEGSIPGSVNLPIMNNEERAEVGTTYKQKGQDLAIQKGHHLVSGKVKQERVQAWKSFIEAHPHAVITCFRGGLRSKITQQWLLEEGLEVPRIEGGYKALRQHLMNAIESFSQNLSQRSLLVISGATGSGKTLLLRSLKSARPICDLELLAHHRGSAFGGYAEGQPSQIDFENRLSLDLIRCLRSVDNRPVLIEDESRMVGRSSLPLSLFTHLRESPIVLIQEDLPSRVQVTYDDYILQSSIGRGEAAEALKVFAAYKLALQRISKKLGGLRTQEVLQDLLKSESQFLDHRELESNRVWITKLLDWYYDPMYIASLQKRQPVVSFKGSRAECREFLLSK